MMFVLSKILWYFTAPDTVLLFLFVLGAVLLWTRYRKAGRWIIASSVSATVIIFIFPIGALLLQPLENRFPANPVLPQTISGIVELGGAHSADMSHARQQVALTTSAERATAAIALTRRYPEAKFIVTAGSGRLGANSLTGRFSVERLHEQLGLDPARVTIIDRSRVTSEAAALAREEISRTGGAWVLVTSAYHMPRSVGLFRKEGVSVIPFPVDYFTDGDVTLDRNFNLADRLGLLRTAVREWLGLTAYYTLGRIDSWFPGPS